MNAWIYFPCIPLPTRLSLIPTFDNLNWGFPFGSASSLQYLKSASTIFKAFSDIIGAWRLKWVGVELFYLLSSLACKKKRAHKLLMSSGWPMGRISRSSILFFKLICLHLPDGGHGLTLYKSSTNKTNHYLLSSTLLASVRGFDHLPHL